MDTDEENPTNCVWGGMGGGIQISRKPFNPFHQAKKKLVNAPNRIQLASICETWVKQTLEKNWNQQLN